MFDLIINDTTPIFILKGKKAQKHSEITPLYNKLYVQKYRPS